MPTSDEARRLQDALATGDERAITFALVQATYAEPDKEWLWEKAVALSGSDSWRLAGAAATAIGNLARIRGYVHPDMIPTLEALAARDPRARPYAEDALDLVRFVLEHPKPGDEYA